MSSFLSRLDPRRSGYQWLLENSHHLIPRPITHTGRSPRFPHVTKRRKTIRKKKFEAWSSCKLAEHESAAESQEEDESAKHRLSMPKITNFYEQRDLSGAFDAKYELGPHEKPNVSLFTFRGAVGPEPRHSSTYPSVHSGVRTRDRLQSRPSNFAGQSRLLKRSETKPSACKIPCRSFTTTCRTAEPAAAVAHDFSRDELDWLVDQYGLSAEEQKPHERITPAPKPPTLDESQTEPGYFDSRAPSSKDIRERLRDFHSLLIQDPPHEQLFDMYRTFTLDELRQCPEDLLHQLLTRFSNVEYRDETSMMRYLAVVEDMREIKVPLLRGEYHSAIMFVGRCFKKISNEHVEKALDRWKAMEGEAKIKANTVTFNALFGIASKARKFVLADMILQEMESRGLEMDRTSRIQLIHYYGLKGDGAGVRKAYRSLVQSGEIVDTSAVSCVIQSLLMCREEMAAEMVFHRMKRLDAEKSNRPLPPSDWQGKKTMRRTLTKCGPFVREDTEVRQQTQDSTPLAPNEQTYGHFIYHYSVRASSFERVTQLVNEMERYDVSLSGRSFFYIFQGFARHGSAPFTAWNWPRLETVFDAFIRGVDVARDGDPWGYIEPDPNPKLYVSQPLTEVCLRAFAKCSGDEERLWEVWDQLAQRWQHNDEQHAKIRRLIRELMDKTASKMPSIRDALRG
ncbi:MAG: hypothetical protein M1831_003323 [Alyxoria varia]|nr:MAG: hypothetical protein M1831_003323 [Alyxoria varia]